MITLALTSIPPRFATLPDRLGALLAQCPDRLCLTLPHRYHRFPDWDGALPPLPSGVTVLRGDDHGPASKFTAAIRTIPGDDLLILDDDCTYHSGWLDAFRAARAAEPGTAIAASHFDSARLGLPSGHMIVQSFAGLLIPTGTLPQHPPDTPDCWVDDIWLSAHLAAAHVPITICPTARACVTAQPAPAALQDTMIDGRSRADLNRAVAHRLRASLGIWRDPVARDKRRAVR